MTPKYNHQPYWVLSIRSQSRQIAAGTLARLEVREVEDALKSTAKARLVRGLRCGSGLLWGLWSGGHRTCPDTSNVIGKYGDSFRVFFFSSCWKMMQEKNARWWYQMYNRRIQSWKIWFMRSYPTSNLMANIMWIFVEYMEWFHRFYLRGD